MNKQEIFDTVYEALMKQGKASIRNGICQYRGPGGTKCAIGHLIPDDLYDPSIESLTFHSLPEYITDHIVGDDEDYKTKNQLLYRLQRAHDQYLNFYGIKEWKESMKDIAYEFNLHFPE